MEVRLSQLLITEASMLDCHLDPILFVIIFNNCRSYAALEFVYCHSSTISTNRVECGGKKQKEK